MAMKVEEIMSPSVATCRATDSASDAARIMWDHDVCFLPVVSESGRVVAMVTDRDLCMAAYAEGKPLADIPVSAVMSPRLAYVRCKAPLAAAEDLLETWQLHRLPVLDDYGHLAGIVTLHDLVRASEYGEGPNARDVMRILVAVMGPKRHVRVRREGPRAHARKLS